MSGTSQGKSYWAISESDYNKLVEYIATFGTENNPYSTLITDFSLTHSSFSGLRFADPESIDPQESLWLDELSDPNVDHDEFDLLPSIGIWVWVLSTNPIHNG